MLHARVRLNVNLSLEIALIDGASGVDGDLSKLELEPGLLPRVRFSHYKRRFLSSGRFCLGTR